MSSDDLWNRGSCKEDNFKRILVADFLSCKDFDILFLSLHHLFLILCQKDNNHTCIDFLRCMVVYFFTSSQLQYKYMEDYQCRYDIYTNLSDCMYIVYRYMCCTMYIHVYHFFLDHKTSLPTPAVGSVFFAGGKASVESHWHEKVEADGQLKALGMSSKK